MVDASFMQTLWNMNPVCSGCELAEGKQLILKFIVEITNLFNVFTTKVMHYFVMLPLFRVSDWRACSASFPRAHG